MDVSLIYNIVRRRIWILALSTGLTLGAAVLGYRLLPPYYRASVLMMPSERVLQQVAQNDAGVPPDSEQRAQQVATLVEVARSRAVSEKASQRLRGLVTTSALQKSMKVERVTDTQAGRETALLRIQYTGDDPRMVVAAANAIAGSFRDFYNEVSHQEAADNRKFLDQQLVRARIELQDRESGLREYRDKQNLISPVTQADSAVQGLASLRSDRDSAAAQLSEVNGRLQAVSLQLRATPKTHRITEMTSEGSASSLLRTQITDMEKELSLLRSRYTPKHPKVTSLESSLMRAREELRRMSGRMVGKDTVTSNPAYASVLDEKLKLSAERNALQAKVSALDKAISKRESELMAYTGADVELERRALDFKTAQETYSAVLNRLNQARMNESLTTDTGAIQVIDPAVKAEGPLRSGPNPVQLFIAASILGIALGAGFCVVTESMDRSIRTASDARNLIDLPVLGVIPALDPEEAGDDICDMSIKRPMSSYAESFRFLATDLLLAVEETDIRTIMVVTARPDQGATAITSNLAITLAQAGKRVILVDADLRQPSLHEVYGVDDSSGLTDALSANLPVAMYARNTDIENLFVVPSGSGADNPWRLFKSERFTELVKDLRKQSDFVFFDSPSAAVFADAMAMSSAVDAVILVMRANEKPGGNELQLIDNLEKAHVKTLGIVLNGTSPSFHNGYHFLDSYYPPSEVEKTSQSMLWRRGRSGNTQSIGEARSDG